jgi:hypothetical protein
VIIIPTTASSETRVARFRPFARAGGVVVVVQVGGFDGHVDDVDGGEVKGVFCKGG